MHVRLVMTSHGRGEVFVDGELLKSVSAVELKVGVGEQNRLTIHCHPDQIDVEGEFDVTTITDEARRFEVGQADPSDA